MDLQTRCNLCHKFFCCTVHRTDHQLKSHSDVYAKEKQDFLVTVFQKKAEKLLLKSQKYKKSVKNVTIQENISVNSYISEDKPKYRQATKRMYSEMNKRIFSTSVSVMSEPRKYLIPVRRLTMFGSNDETGTRQFNEAKEDSPCDIGIGKTSTPINDEADETPKGGVKHMNTPGSTISVYHTPCSQVFTENNLRIIKPSANRGLAVMTPLRSIMAKASKYESDNESGPSPLANSLRSRRVTFSFSSQVSSTNSSPLEVLEEAEIHNEMQEEKLSVSVCVEDTCNDIQELSEGCDNKHLVLEDSPSIKGTGFFNCMTNMFCSAVHTMPSIGSWGSSQNKGSNQLKRGRSPDSREACLSEISSPIHKRPCYPCDLRLNPIKARKPIAQS